MAAAIARRRAAALLPAMVLAACVAPVPLDGPAVAELPAPVPDWIARRATEPDDGRVVTLAVGESLAIALRTPGAAGAGWITTWVPAHLAVTGRSSGPVWPPGTPGSSVATPPVWQVFVVEARGSGEGTLDLQLRAADGTPLRRFALRITVGG